MHLPGLAQMAGVSNCQSGFMLSSWAHVCTADARCSTATCSGSNKMLPTLASQLAANARAPDGDSWRVMSCTMTPQGHLQAAGSRQLPAAADHCRWFLQVTIQLSQTGRITNASWKSPSELPAIEQFLKTWETYFGPQVIAGLLGKATPVL